MTKFLNCQLKLNPRCLILERFMLKLKVMKTILTIIPENSQGVSETSTISRIGQVCDSNTQQDCSQSGPTTENTKTVIQIPKVKQVIKYQLPGSETWIKAQVHTRAGKSTGKYKYHLNLLNDGEKDPLKLDFENQIKTWQPCSSDHLAVKERKEEETHEIFISSAFPKQKVSEANCKGHVWTLKHCVYAV